MLRQFWSRPSWFASPPLCFGRFQGSAILSESVRNCDTGEPGISISINFGKFLVSVSESIITKIWYLTQWFRAFHQNLYYKTCLTLVSVSESESESKFSLFLVSVSISESTRQKDKSQYRNWYRKSWYRRLLADSRCPPNSKSPCLLFPTKFSSNTRKWWCSFNAMFAMFDYTFRMMVLALALRKLSVLCYIISQSSARWLLPAYINEDE